MTTDMKETVKKEDEAFGLLLRKATYAMWPGPTYWGLIRWPDEDTTVVPPPLSLVYNMERKRVLLGMYWRLFLP